MPHFSYLARFTCLKLCFGAACSCYSIRQSTTTTTTTSFNVSFTAESKPGRKLTNFFFFKYYFVFLFIVDEQLNVRTVPIERKCVDVYQVSKLLLPALFFSFFNDRIGTQIETSPSSSSSPFFFLPLTCFSPSFPMVSTLHNLLGIIITFRLVLSLLNKNKNKEKKKSIFCVWPRNE